MNRKAFTLIELLAVIVILAIIVLIAVPIVLNIIEDSKKSSQKESINMYAKALENAITDYQLKNQKDKNVTFSKVEKLINYDGDRIKCRIKKVYKNGHIYLKECSVNGILVDYVYGKEEYKYYIHLVEDIGEKGLSIGDKYTYEVNDTDIFNFYVLSVKEDEVNLIMDRNICRDGTTNYLDTNNYCRTVWHDGSTSNNNYGPDIAMSKLYEGTKDWDNVPDMIMDYTDEQNKNNATYGYVSIITDKVTKITTITGKNNETSNNQIIGNNFKPLKSRMPRLDEVFSLDKGLCGEENGTCPKWLLINLKSQTVLDLNEASVDNIYGYWILATENNRSYAKYVCCYGGVANQSTITSGLYGVGVRPVITVPISNF